MGLGTQLGDFLEVAAGRNQREGMEEERDSIEEYSIE